MPATGPCPNPDALRRLASGETPESIPDTILSHLQECDACSGVFAGVVPSAVAEARHLSAEPPASTADLAEIQARAAALAPDTQPLPATQPPPATGRTLGKFVLLEVLGRGGMGTVYRGRDTVLNRDVAVKLVTTADGSLTPQQRSRFLREATALAKLAHDHIVPVYEVGEADDTPYLVMPLLAGRTLTDHRRAAGKLSAAEVCRLGGQVAAGLAAAHAVGLVHRDVKPSNVWVEPDGTARLLDFGLAKPTAADAAALTASFALAGTPPYMSPEQAGAGAVDQRSDLFSLGVVLFEMANGRALFADGPGKPPVLAQVQRFDGLSPKAAWPAGPRAVAALISQMLQPDPAKRPASAAEVSAKLLAAATTPVRKRPAWPAVVGLAMAAAVLIAAGWEIVIRIRVENGKTEASASYSSDKGTPPTQPSPAPPATDLAPDFLDATAYLPFGASVPRKVTDFLMVTDKTPAELAHWAKSLGDEYVPVAIGQFAGESPRPQLHAIAYKLTGPPVKATIVETPADAPPGPGVIQKLWVRDPQTGPSSVELRVDGLKGVEFTATGNALFAAKAEGMRKERKVPQWIGPEGGRDGLKTHAAWAFNADRRAWTANTDWFTRSYHLTVRDLADRNHYISSIASYLSVEKKAKLCVVSRERPDDRDWFFPEHQRTGDLTAASNRLKTEGFMPVAIASYQWDNAPAFAVAWVRNRPRAVPPCTTHWTDLAVALPKAPAGTRPDMAAVVPFSDDVRREMLDFSVALDKTPEELHRWANTIDREYSVLNLGGNADMPPPRVHGIAVKFKGGGPKTFLRYQRNHFPEMARIASFEHCDQMNCRVGCYTATGEWWDINCHTEDCVRWWHEPVWNDGMVSLAASLTKKQYKPSLLWRITPGDLWGVHSLTTSHATTVRLEANLSPDALREFVNGCERDRAVLTHVIRYMTPNGDLRFGACALTTPAGLTGRFRQEMTKEALLNALADYKRDGYCPLSITSSGTGDATRYTASWIRFVVPEK